MFHFTLLFGDHGSMSYMAQQLAQEAILSGLKLWLGYNLKGHFTWTQIYIVPVNVPGKNSHLDSSPIFDQFLWEDLRVTH